MAVLVARDVVEALDESRQRAVLLVVADDEVLAGQGEHSLDDHVVERDGLHQRLEVAGVAGELVDAGLEQVIEELVELGVEVRARLLETAREAVGLEHADLLVEAVEERDVAGFVRDLRAEEDAHLLGGRRAHHRAELLGHLLLADEERAEPVHALVLLVVGKALPVEPVLGEVEVLRAPLLALPELVQLAVGEELHVAAIRGLHDGRIAGGLEVLPVGAASRGIAHGRLPLLGAVRSGKGTARIGWPANYGPGSAVASMTRVAGVPLLFLTR